MRAVYPNSSFKQQVNKVRCNTLIKVMGAIFASSLQSLRNIDKFKIHYFRLDSRMARKALNHPASYLKCVSYFIN